MCGPEDPLFTPLLPLSRVPFQAKESVHKTPFWENLEILASTASIFAQILVHKHPNLESFSSQAPKFENFQLTSPPNLKIFCSQAPLFRSNCQFASPILRKSGPHTPTWKKVECPPGGWYSKWHVYHSRVFFSTFLIARETEGFLSPSGMTLDGGRGGGDLRQKEKKNISDINWPIFGVLSKKYSLQILAKCCPA